MMSAVLLVRTSLGPKPRFRELPQMSFTVYLSGEIHSDWRDEIKRGAAEAGLDVTFTAPVTDHPASDAAGDHLGETHSDFWRDHQSAKVNAIRTRTLIGTPIS